jgi:peptidyl-prolyl cis-trans isomerase D
MLDRMRRHRSWLKWSLGIVVATFIILYVPTFMPAGPAGSANDTIASIGGRKVTVGAFQRAYSLRTSAMRSAYGEQFNEQMLLQLGMDRRILEELLNDEAAIVEAERLGIRVSDQELRDRILTFPAFQDNGAFIGEARYRQFLGMQRPPLTADEFERDIRRQLMAEKLQAMITGWVHVDDAEVEREYRRRNEKVKVELAVFKADQFRKAIQPTDGDIQARFEGNKESYRLPEKRRVKYVAVDASALKNSMTATPQELEAMYKRNQAMYSTPDQFRSSHILFKTEGKDEAVVKKQAEAVLAKVKAGGDFAALAKQYSEDTSKDLGGDLDFKGRGEFVKEFEDAALALEVGKVAPELVKSQFGFHIIKLTAKRAATTKTLNDVRPQLEDQIKSEKAQVEAAKKADAMAARISSPADLEKVAREENLVIGDSGLFSREEPMAGLGFAPEVSSKAFELESGKVSGKLQTGQGFAWIVVTEIKPAALPTLEEVKDKVRDDVVREKAVALAREKAETMARSAKANFAAAAKAAGVEVKTTDLISRGSAFPEVGVNETLEDAVFSLKTGDSTGAIATDNAVVVARLKERQDFKPEEYATGKIALLGELRQRKGTEFFAAYMIKAKEKMGQPTYNETALAALTGRR